MATAKDIYIKIEDLLVAYEGYIIFHDTATLDIIINEDSISFYLLDGEIEDNIIITFDEKEKEMLNFLSIFTIIKLFGKVLIHFDDGVVYNNKHRRGIRVTILNEQVKDLVKKIVTIQDSEFIDMNLEVVKDLEKKAQKNYSNKFVLALNDRIFLSKRVLK